MGRYYGGDIAGKFWFAVQSSFDARHFGVEPTGPRWIYSSCMEECGPNVHEGDPCPECSSDEECVAIEHNEIEFQFDTDHIETVQNTLNNLAVQLLAKTSRFAEVLTALDADQAWMTQDCSDDAWITETVDTVLVEVTGTLTDDDTFNVLAARYWLGTQILRCLRTKGSCCFWCEL